MRVIDDSRLVRLLKATLDALIAGGVDNWEFYGASLNEDNCFNERRNASANELLKSYKEYYNRN